MNPTTVQVNIMDMLGDYVKFQRTKKGITQQELADKVREMGFNGINANYISRIERKDIAGMNISNLEKVIGALDSSIQFIEQ